MCVSTLALSALRHLNSYSGLIASIAALVGLLYLRGQLKVMAMQNKLLSDEAKERKARAFVVLDSALQPLLPFLSPHAEMLRAGGALGGDGWEWFLGGHILEIYDPTLVPAWDEATVLDACAIAAPEYVGQVRLLLKHFADYRDVCREYVAAGSPDQSPPNIGEDKFLIDPIRRKYSDAVNGMINSLSAIINILPAYRKAE